MTENHIVVDELWDDPPLRRCKVCGKSMSDCDCDGRED
jgi:hypothetical protein